MSSQDNIEPEDREIEKIMKDAMAFAGIGLLRFRLDGSILSIDDVILSILGLEERYPTSADAIGLNAKILLADAFLFEKVRDEIEKSGPVIDLEFRIKTLTGSFKWIRCDAYLLNDREEDPKAVQMIMRDITKDKKMADRISKLNECLLGFSAHPLDNINKLTRLTGELLGATCALYNRLDEGLLCSIGQWRTPPDFKSVDDPNGHICYDLIQKNSGDVLLVRDLSNSRYAKSDPAVDRYGLETYMGIAVKLGDHYVGSLCVVYQHDYVPSNEDKTLLSVVASALAVEEERRVAKEAFQQSEERYRALVNLSPDAIAVHGGGIVLFVNDAALRLFGAKSDDELLGKPILTFVHPDYHDLARGRIAKMKAGGKRVPVAAEKFVRLDGRLLDVEVAASPIQYQGKPAVQVVMRDITDRKRVESALRESEEKYRAALEQSIESIYLLDIETGRIIESNAALSGLLGYSEEEMKDFTVYDFVAHSTDDIDDRIAEVRAQKRVFLGQRWYRHKKGTLIPVEVSAAYIAYGGKEALCVVARDITERKMAVEALRESEDKYRTLTENLNVGVYRNTVGPQGRFIEANQAIVRMFGFGSREEFLSLSVSDMYEDPKEREELNQRMLTAGFVKDEELRLMRKDGTGFVGSVSAVSVNDEGGAVKFHDGQIVDVTEQKRAREALQRSELRYRTTIDSMADAIHMIDREFRIVLFNKSFEQWSRELGLDADAVGRTLRDVFPFLPERVYDEYRRVFATGEILLTEEENTVSGREIVTETRKIAVYEGDTVSRVVTAVRDITERRQADEALRASEERYRGLFDNATDLVFTLDLAGTFTAVNRASKHHTGCTAEELVGVGFRQYVARHDIPRVIRAYRQVYATGTPIQDFPLEVKVKDGSTKHFELSVGLLRRGTEIIGFQGSARDITQRLRLEEQLRQAAKMEAIGQLAGGIAHDFNNLLTGILGYANILKLKSEPGSMTHTAAETIERAAERAEVLTKQLLGFARRGRHQVVPVDLHKTTTEVVNLLARTLEKSIRITVKLEADNATTQGDPGQLQQMLLNLAINARDAMPNGGDLTFETQRVRLDDKYCRQHLSIGPGDYVMIAVTDSGKGIAPEIQKRLYEPFFTTRSLGTGMGLAMVYGIVKNHGGDIQVYSEVGLGTTFRVHLPVSSEREPGRSEAAVDEPLRGSGRILVVDDEDIVRDATVEMLQELGYEANSVSDGHEAIQFYGKNLGSIDLVIIDLVMPGIDGMECFRKLKKIDPDIKAILSTGYGMNGKVQETIDEGMLGFVQKPYQLVELGRRLREALGR